MPFVGFEPTIPASERAKTVHVSYRSATAAGEKQAIHINTPHGQNAEFLMLKQTVHIIVILLFNQYVHLSVGLPKSLLPSGLYFIVLHIYIHSAFFDSDNPNNTTSVEAMRRLFNRKPETAP
jgi:hypothetical protein